MARPVRFHQPHAPEHDYFFALHEQPAIHMFVSSNAMTARTVPYDTLSGAPEDEERRPVTFSLDGVIFQLEPRRS